MISVQYANAMVETLHYLKGIKQEYIDKIPPKFLLFLRENASPNYKCNFDYTKPIRELKLLDETRGIIAMICLNYWCDSEEKKQEFLNKLTENENKYQIELRKKYNPDDIFKKRKEVKQEYLEQNEEKSIKVIPKEKWYKNIFNKIKEFFKRK